VFDVTYDELTLLITNSRLFPYQKYRITDFRTIHYFLDGNLPIASAVNVGAIEALVVTATSANTISKDASSSDFSNDYIEYDWDNRNYTTDPSFSVSGAVIPGLRGVIRKRYDAIQKNTIGSDFRNVKVRRWKISCPDYAGNGVGYGKTTCVDGRDGFIYEAVDVIQPGNALNLNSPLWRKKLKTTEELYLSPYSTVFNYMPVNSADFIDVPIFQSYGWIKNTIIDSVDDGVIGNYCFYVGSRNTNCDNNKMLLKKTTVKGTGFTRNTGIATDVIFGSDVSDNRLGTLFAVVFGASIYSNDFNALSGCVIGDNCYYNNIRNAMWLYAEDGFQGNMITTAMRLSFGSSVSYNTIGSGHLTYTGDGYQYNNGTLKFLGDISGDAYLHSDHPCEISYNDGPGLAYVRSLNTAGVYQVTLIGAGTLLSRTVTPAEIANFNAGGTGGTVTSDTGKMFTQILREDLTMFAGMSNKTLIVDCPVYEGMNVLSSISLIGKFKPCTITIYFIGDHGWNVYEKEVVFSDEDEDYRAIDIVLDPDLELISFYGEFFSVAYTSTEDFMYKGIIVNYIKTIPV